jgi:hypothetical protein
MKVYLVAMEYNEVLYGVFSTREKAQQYLDATFDAEEKDSYFVKEFEVDELTPNYVIPETSHPEYARDPEPVPFGEPFGQSIQGIVHTWPELDPSIVKKAEKDFRIESFGNNVHVHYMLTDRLSTRTIWSPTSLPAEYAFVLYRELRYLLFGSDPKIGFKSKPGPNWYCPQCGMNPNNHSDFDCNFVYDIDTTKWAPHK